MKLAAITAFALVGLAVAQTVHSIPTTQVGLVGEIPAEWWQPKDVAAIAGAVVALAALLKGLLEYELQGRQKRAEHFLTMRLRFKDNEAFRELCALCEQDDEKLQTVPFKDKRDILGFFEEVALMTNSGLLRPRVAQYMFGYYAIRCWRSANFWHGVNRDSLYWTLFREFVAKMEAEEKKFKASKGGLRF